MGDEIQLTRAQLAERLATAEAKLAAVPDIGALVAAEVAKALAAQPKPQGDPIVERLQRELDEARAQIKHLRPDGMPQNYVTYKGHVQATQDWWEPIGGYHFGPQPGKAGEVSYIETNEYWPGCPFVPVIVTGTREDGLPKVEPHPQFSRN
jgi:hypothetical protein